MGRVQLVHLEAGEARKTLTWITAFGIQGGWAWSMALYRYFSGQPQSVPRNGSGGKDGRTKPIDASIEVFGHLALHPAQFLANSGHLFETCRHFRWPNPVFSRVMQYELDM